MRYFISDTHFGHKNIIEYENRPFASVEEMDEVLIANWNSVVTEDDLVYFLGDFGLCLKVRGCEVFKRLNGHKVAIIGNHDKRNVLEGIGFTIVLDEAWIKINGHQMRLIHIPPTWIEGQAHITLHGHVHGKQSFDIIEGRLNVSVEVIDYKPVSELIIGAKLDKWFSRK